MHIAKKLESLHATGWVHRDLKPGNTIWLPSENEWALIDFGCVGEVRAFEGMTNVTLEHMRIVTAAQWCTIAAAHVRHPASRAARWATHDCDCAHATSLCWRLPCEHLKPTSMLAAASQQCGTSTYRSQPRIA